MYKRLLIAILIILAAAVIFSARFLTGEDSWICENGQWVKHGNPSALMPISGCGNNEQPEEQGEIVVVSPQLNQIVESPLKVEGRAKGSWFFEAVFPVKLVDANGKDLAVGHVQATEDWMTENFVLFTAELKFQAPDTSTGTLIFHNDNPSGLPESDKEFSVPVRFK